MSARRYAQRLIRIARALSERSPSATAARERACVHKHFGLYAIEPRRGTDLANAGRAGALVPLTEEQIAAVRWAEYLVDNEIAIIPVEGTMMKPVSKFGGCSTTRLRELMAHAIENPDVKGLMLVFDTPGGYVDGVPQLAESVRALRTTKPIHGHIEDLCASAGYWVGAQCRRLTASRGSIVGSIGVFVALYDQSGQFEREGIRTRVIRYGDRKGRGALGEPMDEALYAEVQAEVDAIGEMFVGDVAAGRGIDLPVALEWATGNVWSAESAPDGMIDGVASFDEAFDALVSVVRGETGQHTEAVPRAPEPHDDEGTEVPGTEGAKTVGFLTKTKAEEVEGTLEDTGFQARVAAALGIESTEPDAILAAIAEGQRARSAAEARAETAPDMGEIVVTRAEYDALIGDVAALKAREDNRVAIDRVRVAMLQGKVSPAGKARAIKDATADPAAFDERMASIPEGTFVDYSTHGESTGEPDDARSAPNARQVLNDKAEAYMREHEVTFSAAVDAVVAAQPSLGERCGFVPTRR